MHNSRAQNSIPAEKGPPPTSRCIHEMDLQKTSRLRCLKGGSRMNALKLSGRTRVAGLIAVGLATLLLLASCAAPPAVNVEATAQSLAHLWVAQTAEAQPRRNRALSGRLGNRFRPR